MSTLFLSSLPPGSKSAALPTSLPIITVRSEPKGSRVYWQWDKSATPFLATRDARTSSCSRPVEPCSLSLHLLSRFPRRSPHTLLETAFPDPSPVGGTRMPGFLLWALSMQLLICDYSLSQQQKQEVDLGSSIVWKVGCIYFSLKANFDLPFNKLPLRI